MHFEIKNMFNKKNKESNKDKNKNYKDILFKDIADNTLKIFSFNNKNKIQYKTDSNINSSNTLNNCTDTVIKSKHQINIIEWFKRNEKKDNNCHNHHSNTNEVKSNSIINAIKSITNKSYKKTNNTINTNNNLKNEKKNVDKMSVMKNKKLNSNIFKKFLLKKKDDNQPHKLSELPLDKFESTNIEHLNRVTDWKKRNDIKFVGHESEINSLLQMMCKDFFIMEHEGFRLMSYRTKYFDTSDNIMFQDHQYNMCKRYKIRKRHYNNGDDFWLEVKEKIDGETHKYRVLNPKPNEIETFIQTNSPYAFYNLHNKLTVQNNRMTFIHKTLPIKITLDKNLKVSNSDGSKCISFPNLAILELKRENYSTFDLKWIESCGFESCNISKYCVGMITLHPELKKKSFKHQKTLFKINNISKNI